LITDTKSTVFDNVNLPVEVFSSLWKDSVCSRWLLLIATTGKGMNEVIFVFRSAS